MKKQVILMSLAIAGLLCCIPMFVLNAPGAPGLSGGAASLLGMAGAVLFGTCAGTLLQLKRLSRDPDYRQRQKAQCDERNQAIRDRAGCIAGFWTVGLLVVSGLISRALNGSAFPTGWAGCSSASICFTLWRSWGFTNGSSGRCEEALS